MSESGGEEQEFSEDGREETDDCELFSRRLAASADLCLSPLRHAVIQHGLPPDHTPAGDDRDQGGNDLGLGNDTCWRIEARGPDGCRCPEGDLDLEIYRSSKEFNLMLTSVTDEEAPILWHGTHAVWIHSDSGQRCEGPYWRLKWEALARRIRALVAGD